MTSKEIQNITKIKLIKEVLHNTSNTRINEIRPIKKTVIIKKIANLNLPNNKHLLTIRMTS